MNLQKEHPNLKFSGIERIDDINLYGHEVERRVVSYQGQMYEQFYITVSYKDNCRILLAKTQNGKTTIAPFASHENAAHSSSINEISNDDDEVKSTRRL